jgi:hypothetical protein
VQNSRVHIALVLGLFAVCAPGITARDFPEPLPLMDPWLAVEQSGGLPAAGARPVLLLAPAAYGDVAYHPYWFRDGEHDSFSVRGRAGGVPVALGPIALGVYWNTVLLVGPVAAEDDPASIALWWMNAVQFEYGIVVGARLPAPLRSASLEYGRTSQHPLRPAYSEVSADIVRAAVWARTLCPRGPAGSRGRVTVGLSVGYLDLFEFWESDLLRPRTLLRGSVPLEAAMPLLQLPGGTVNLYLAAEPRLLLLRASGVAAGTDLEPPVQLELDAELGVQLQGRARTEIGVEVFSTSDTEQVRGTASPLTTVGVVFRVRR